MSGQSIRVWLLAQGENLDPVPEPADVNAGLVGLLVFLGLIVAVVLLLVLMSRQLKTVNRKASEGAYDDLPTRRSQSRDGVVDKGPGDAAV